jgi:hypothetical protein
MHRNFCVWQLIDQEKIQDKCLSEDPKERIKAFKKFKSDFLLLPDKQKAWNDLIKLTKYYDYFGRKFLNRCPMEFN